MPSSPHHPRRISLQKLQSPEEMRLAFWGLYADANTKIMRLVEQLADRQGLTLSQYDVLANLTLRPGLTQGELAQRLQVTKGNICGLIDRLEKLKWVQRRPDEDDRRINRLHLTDAGAETYERMKPQHDELVLAFLATFSDEEVETFRNFLERLERSAAQS